MLSIFVYVWLGQVDNWSRQMNPKYVHRLIVQFYILWYGLEFNLVAWIWVGVGVELSMPKILDGITDGENFSWWKLKFIQSNIVLFSFDLE